MFIKRLLKRIIEGDVEGLLEKENQWNTWFKSWRIWIEQEYKKIQGPVTSTSCNKLF